jgi:hypothetical protein
MMQLPFRQLAIFDPSISHPHWQGQALGRQELAELAHWAVVARRKSAEACYLRITDEAMLAQVHWALTNDFHLILPASLSHMDLKAFAWHHKSGSQFPASSKASLSSISCHNLQDLEQAAQNGFDFAFLSPIFSTQTHPEAMPLGLEQLELAAKSSPIPIIALGGMDAEKGQKSMAAGALAWAAIRYFL